MLLLAHGIAKNRFVYRGLVGGADNAVGVLETNIPLDEIVESPQGNQLFSTILSTQNAATVRDEYYRKHNLPTERTPGHLSYAANEVFALGTIIRENGKKFTYTPNISDELEAYLARERRVIDTVSKSRAQESIEPGFPTSIICAKTSCELFPIEGGGFGYRGVNTEAIHYELTDIKTSSTPEGYYITKGQLKFKLNSTSEGQSNDSADLPNSFQNVVIYTSGQSLVNYRQYKHFSSAIGELFRYQNLDELNQSGEKILYVGGIGITEKGECKTEKGKTPIPVIVSAEGLLRTEELEKADLDKRREENIAKD